MKNYLKNLLKKFQFSLFEFKYNYIDNFILRKEICDYCKYFGGLMCDHTDENGLCLGFERYKFTPIKNFIRKRKVKRIVKELRKWKS